MHTRFFILLAFYFVVQSTWAQKIKYKDLILLLTSKQYEKAEPFLKRYLKENADNPNAYLYMGIIFQDKAAQNDPLIHTEILCSNIDSAILNYDKAYKTITEKELRKNDEYYEAYMRRDLRTGKFVIKLSDVQLDIETRTKSLKDRKEKVKLLRKYFEESSSSYVKSNKIYKELQASYGNEKQFFLRSDEGMVSALQHLALVFDSTLNAFGHYKSTSKELGKTGHDQVIDLQEIKDMKRDGSVLADFMKDDLKIWDYKRWATEATSTIEKEINPLRQHLVEYDVEINKLRAKLQKDSASVKNDLIRLLDKILSSQLKKYDPDPMPLVLFNLKVAELEFQSDLVLNKNYHDSLNWKRRLSATQMELEDLRKLDSLGKALSKRNFDEEEKDYKDFITKAYGTTSVLTNMISATTEFVNRETNKKQMELATCVNAMKWIINASDSIPLFTDSSRDLKFKPLLIDQERFTAGLAYTDSIASAYFFTITPSRIPDVKATFPVDPVAFNKNLLSHANGTAISDGPGNIFITMLYSSQKVGDKFLATIAKIYRADGLSWANNFSFDALPSELSINSDTGAISVKLIAAEGTTRVALIDKNGKLIN